MSGQPELRVQILGPLRIFRGGAEVDIGPRQQALVLGILLARHDRPVGMGDLISIVWGEEPPARAVNVIHKYIGALRRVLEPHVLPREEGTVILRKGNGYVCVLDADVLDLARFHDHLTAARLGETQNRTTAAFEHYAQAIELWSGPAGEDLLDNGGSAPVFSGLTVEFIGACMAATRLASDPTMAARVLPSLRLACAIDQLHEPLHSGLMVALEAAGQRAEALAVFDGIRRRLADELGIDPGQNLMAAYGAVLGPPAADATPTIEHSPEPQHAERSLTAEPYRVNDFTGRPEELALIRQFVEHDSGTTPTSLLITGPPGVGKTTTALEALQGAPGRLTRLFVDLHGFESTPTEPLQILRALLIQITPGTQPPASLDDASAAWRAAVGARQLVVVLDNASSEAQVRPVLSVDAPLKVIITCRRTLPGLESTSRLALQPLAIDDSVDLLSALIPADQRSEAELGELAGLCGNFPLALRIAGARVAAQPGWSAADFIGRLHDQEDRLDQLVAGDLAIERAFSRSYDFLSTEERHLFASLSLLHGPNFSVAMAARAAGLEPAQTRAQLDTLADLCLIEIRRGDRYRVHDLLRLYADRVLRTESVIDDILSRQVTLDRWILKQVGSAARVFPPIHTPLVTFTPDAEEMRRSFDWLTIEAPHWYGSLKDSAARGDNRVVVDAALALGELSDEWWRLGHLTELHTIAAECARRAGDDEAHVRLLIFAAESALTEQSVASTTTPTPPQIADRVSRAVEAAEAWGDPYLIAAAHHEQAFNEFEAGRFESALARFREVAAQFAALAQTSHHFQARSRILRILAQTDLEAALVEGAAAVEAIDALGDVAVQLQPESHANVLNAVARINLTAGRWPEALDAATRMLAAPPAFFDRGGYAGRALRHRGFALIGLARFDEARTTLNSALEHVGPYRPDWWAADIQKALDSLPDEA